MTHTFNWRTPQVSEPGAWGTDCAQCDQPKEEDNNDPMCEPCTTQHWEESHGHPFPQPKRGNQ